MGKLQCPCHFQLHGLQIKDNQSHQMCFHSNFSLPWDLHTLPVWLSSLSLQCSDARSVPELNGMLHGQEIEYDNQPDQFPIHLLLETLAVNVCVEAFAMICFQTILMLLFISLFHSRKQMVVDPENLQHRVSGRHPHCPHLLDCVQRYMHNDCLFFG